QGRRLTDGGSGDGGQDDRAEVAVGQQVPVAQARVPAGGEAVGDRVVGAEADRHLVAAGRGERQVRVGLHVQVEAELHGDRLGGRAGERRGRRSGERPVGR